MSGKFHQKVDKKELRETESGKGLRLQNWPISTLFAI